MGLGKYGAFDLTGV